MAAPMVTPLDAGAAAAAYNATHTRLAVADLAGRLSLWQRTEGSAGGWTLASSLPAEGLRITSLCWAPKEFGGVLAGGASDGSVAVWQEAPGDGAWRLAAVLKEGALGVQDLAFAPPELGPLVAAAYADGAVRWVLGRARRGWRPAGVGACPPAAAGAAAVGVWQQRALCAHALPLVPALALVLVPICRRRFFEASAVLAADSWELQNYFRLGRAAGAATALSWRQPAPGLPPLLVVGTAAAGAQVWAYRRQLMRWEQEATLGGPTVSRRAEHWLRCAATRACSPAGVASACAAGGLPCRSLHKSVLCRQASVAGTPVDNRPCLPCAGGWRAVGGGCGLGAYAGPAVRHRCCGGGPRCDAVAGDGRGRQLGGEGGFAACTQLCTVACMLCTRLHTQVLHTVATVCLVTGTADSLEAGRWRRAAQHACCALAARTWTLVLYSRSGAASCYVRCITTVLHAPTCAHVPPPPAAGGAAHAAAARGRGVAGGVEPAGKLAGSFHRRRRRLPVAARPRRGVAAAQPGGGGAAGRGMRRTPACLQAAQPGGMLPCRKYIARCRLNDQESTRD